MGTYCTGITIIPIRNRASKKISQTRAENTSGGNLLVFMPTFNHVRSAAGSSLMSLVTIKQHSWPNSQPMNNISCVSRTNYIRDNYIYLAVAAPIVPGRQTVPQHPCALRCSLRARHFARCLDGLSSARRGSEEALPTHTELSGLRTTKKLEGNHFSRCQGLLGRIFIT